MDVWAYLNGLKRWWWLLVAIPALTFLLASFVLVPPAKWTVTWTSAIVFDGDPNVANQSAFLDYVLLDDMTHLLQSDVLGDRVYLQLPEDMTRTYSRDEVGEMYDSVRHARFVEIMVSADEPDVARTVAEVTRTALPEAINLYLIPPDFSRVPAQVSVTTLPGEPELQTRERLLKVGGVTLAGVAVGFGAAGVAEWLRLSYREKYGSR
jgi:capsular polysaccharide biosynthesis protein